MCDALFLAVTTIVLIRLVSPSRHRLLSRVEEVFQYENVNVWPGCFVVVTERKVRVRTPPKQS